jgi:hypothetical protein
LHCNTLKFSLLAQISWWLVAIQNGDLLPPRRQERQVRKLNFFAAFAPLREIIPSFGCGFAALGSLRLNVFVTLDAPLLH